MLDAVCAYLRSPLDAPPGGGEEIERPTDDDAPLCALAFKVMSIERLGLGSGAHRRRARASSAGRSSVVPGRGR